MTTIHEYCVGHRGAARHCLYLYTCHFINLVSVPALQACLVEMGNLPSLAMFSGRFNRQMLITLARRPPLNKRFARIPQHSDILLKPCQGKPNVFLRDAAATR
jgi:hypothetical protein